MPEELSEFKIRVMKKWDKVCYGPLVAVLYHPEIEDFFFY